MLARSARLVAKYRISSFRQFFTSAFSDDEEAYDPHSSSAFTEHECDPSFFLAPCYPTRFDYADAIETFEGWLKKLHLKPFSLRKDPSAILTHTQKIFVPFWYFDVTCHTGFICNVSWNPVGVSGGALPEKEHRENLGMRYPPSFEGMGYIANHSNLLKEEGTHFKIEDGETQFERMRMDPTMTLECDVNVQEAHEIIQTKLFSEEKLRVHTILNRGGANNVKNLQINTGLVYNEDRIIFIPAYFMYYQLNGKIERAVVNAFDGSINGKRHYSRPQLAVVGAAIGGVTALFANASFLDISLTAACTGFLAVFLPLLTSHSKRYIASAEVLNTTSYVRQERAIDDRIIRDILATHDEWLVNYKHRGQEGENVLRRATYHRAGYDAEETEEAEGRALHGGKLRRKVVRFTELYKVLGISTRATSEEIRQAFTILAKKYHPDIQQELDQGSFRRFQEILTAFNVLKDPVRRANYDKTGATESRT